MKLRKVSRRAPIGIVPDAPQHYGVPSPQAPGAEILVLEFDDQGLCHDRRQMTAISARLADLRPGACVQDAVFITFVHGWKHNGAPDDDALRHFTAVVEKTAAKERSQGAAGRPVIGIFVAWRGLSLYGFGLENLTFWHRKRASARVATGAVQELLGRLRQFRAEREQAAPGRTVLIVIGHGFGGTIIYNAVVQSLIEAAATEGDDTVPGFANLVLLVNPAFEAARYLPIHTLLRERSRLHLPPQLRPVFVSVTAANDWATGYSFPLSMLWARVFESANTRREKTALCNTMGHVDWLRTHELTLANRHPLNPAMQRRFGTTVLRRVQFGTENPFWTVRATPAILDGHNGIFKSPFLEFLQALVFDHLQGDPGLPGGVAAIDQQIGACHEAGCAAGQEQGGLGDLVRLA